MTTGTRHCCVRLLAVLAACSLTLASATTSGQTPESTTSEPHERAADHEPDRDSTVLANPRRGLHGSATLGWFGALSGPLPHGPAAELEIHPGGALGRLGLGLYYRGLERVTHGSLALGLSYEVGASRPKLMMGLHADIGYDTANSLPLIGVGLRNYLGIAGPLVISSNLTAHLFLDGLDSRLGFALTLSAGVAH